MGFFGLSQWFVNFTQMNYKAVTKRKMAEIDNPVVEYGIYCLIKTTQLASFLGGCVVHPIYRYQRLQKLTPETTTNNSTKVIRNACRRMQGRFLIGGILLSPWVTLASIYWNGYSREELCDRCYAIRCNTDALIYDRATVLFGLIGWYWKRFQGAVDGVNLAIPYALFYLKVQKPYTNPLMVDYIKPEERYRAVDEARNEETALLKFAHSTTSAKE